MGKAIKGMSLERALRVASYKVVTANVPVIAMGSGDEVPVFVAPVKGQIIQIGFIPEDAITGADTDYYTLSFQNKGAAGAGTDVIATKAYTNGVDVTALDWEPLTIAGNQNLEAGDTVTMLKTETGNGLASVAMLAVVVFEPAL